MSILQDYTFQVVLSGSMILGFISGLIGTFAVLRRQSLLGDAISHASLPGVVLAYMLFNTKETPILLFGAFIFGIIAIYLINIISKRSIISFDSSLAIILSVFYGFGMMLLTYIQNEPDSSQAGLEKFIFGQAASILIVDVQLILVLGIVVLLLTFIFWKEIKLLTFDEVYLETLGYSSKFINLLLFSLLIVVIIIGLETVGVILISALLIAPGVAARQWSDKLIVVAILAGIFGTVSAFFGTYLSSSIEKMPTGPAIVIIVTFITIISILIAPKRGIISRYITIQKNKYELEEIQLLVSIRDHQNQNIVDNKKLTRVIKKSIKKTYLDIDKNTEKYTLTKKGEEKLNSSYLFGGEV